MDERYNPQAIETAVQQRWTLQSAYRADEDPAREKFYCLCMFPYPSGRLHMGHVRNYTIGDVISRYQRMCGKNVLQPMGWDAFGLPAENAAIENNIPPAKWTRANIEDMKAQLQRLGFGYDWDRELATCDPEYYRWEQWFFTRLYEKGLVYRKKSLVNWDPVDQTVLANEQVIDGCGWRSGAPVERREIPQWFLKITAYADELLDGLDDLEGWPNAVKVMQRNWIGRSRGLSIKFRVVGGSAPLEVFTTRPDTLLGATYMAVAPEHPLAVAAAEQRKDVAEFVASCRAQSTSEAAIEKLDKRGVPLGIEVEHPLSGERLPVWVANFVLITYGTGAVMSVPAHDQRDWEFARAFGLAIKPVIKPAGGDVPDIEQGAFTEKGELVNSGAYDGMDFDTAFDAITQALGDSAQTQVQYRLRDWLVSRQRYWGCPIPMVYEGEAIHPEAAERLPVALPEEIEWQGVVSPLQTTASFVETTVPGSNKPARRETDTFDTFFESSWYFSRYCSPGATDGMVDERARYWMPVDIYIGGIEHAVLHLLYARFFHKLMRDDGLVDGPEPFKQLLTQGMVCKETYFRVDEQGRPRYFNPADVDVERDDKGAVVAAQAKADGEPVQIGPVEKMSKSKNNGVDPAVLVEKYGADTVRLYTMFAAPPDQSLEWSDSAVEGAFRFLRNLWRLVADHVANDSPVGSVEPEALNKELKALRQRVHATIAKVTDDVARRYKFNTAIAAVMELINALSKARDSSPAGRAVMQEGLEVAVRLLAPITPHCTDALWSALGHTESLLDTPWPRVDQQALAQDEIEVVVQINGKKRALITVPASADKAALEARAIEDQNIQRHVGNHEIKKIVVVPNKLVNIVVAT
ncbi:MAG: leucine--tRNA ligase [Pseudomonadota bacterium]